MADIRGFRGFRYDLGRVGSLSEVVAPPYDVVWPDLQRTLYGQSEFNAIRLELTRDELGDTERENRYARAARLRNGSTKRAAAGHARSLYIYEQEFAVDGRPTSSSRLFARVGGALRRVSPTNRRCPARRTTGSGSIGPPVQPVADLRSTPDPEVVAKEDPHVERAALVATDHPATRTGCGS